MISDLDLRDIQDEKAREVKAENQRLRDEVNYLKGEQGKPKIKGNTSKPAEGDHSSEKERRKARERHKSSRKASIVIDREQVLEIDRAILLEDAQIKGYEDVVVQDLRVRTDNLLFHKEKYYSTSAHKS